MAETQVADEPRALNERWTQLRLAGYLARALGILLTALPLILVAGALLTDTGDTRPGVPEFVPLGLMAAALLAILAGISSLLCAVAMAWVLAREPWRQVSSRYELMEADESREGLGDPVLHLSASQHQWPLTLVAVYWRWARFASGTELLFAGRPGRGGVVATMDQGAIAWAGGPRFTARLLRRRRKGEVPPDPPTHQRL